MNTEFVLAAEGTGAGPAFLAARAFIDESEARFTRFSEESELMQLNRSPGVWFHASADLFELVQEARQLTRATDGLFDPAVYEDLLALGYDRSFDSVRLTAGPVGRSVPRTRRGSLLDVELAASERAICLPPGLRLDLGGIAKGWVAERATQRMMVFTTACAVNAGGDLYVHGRPADDSAWKVGLEDPRTEGRLLAMLHIASGAVATSSRTRRRWIQGDRERHHLIDPRTGLPSATDWLSVTAIASHASEAEAFAKALHLAGPEGAATLAETRPGLRFLVVDEDGQLWGSAAAKEVIRDGMGTS